METGGSSSRPVELCSKPKASLGCMSLNKRKTPSLSPTDSSKSSRASREFPQSVCQKQSTELTAKPHQDVCRNSKIGQAPEGHIRGREREERFPLSLVAMGGLSGRDLGFRVSLTLPCDIGQVILSLWTSASSSVKWKKPGTIKVPATAQN